ncbi:PDZ domain-containing protein GIPC1 isoform X1 [Ixodes scapularis]|uniref:PDZ domain-containing protein GIPC1 isoform X1 n=1 Tax=Ixodes scapularis TaxID=6945 RepID=UPI001A9D7F1A|nr:PDZ domain-containing protein GIPC1 isoform X1 [Ixodes scapularis]
MPLFGKKKRDSDSTSQTLVDGDTDGVSAGHSPTANGGSPASPAGGGNGTATDPHSKNVPKPKLVFHCQQAQGSPTGIISGFSNIKELYLKIAECYDFPASDILFCTLNTHKVDMARLLGGQIGLDDFIFVHRRGQPKEVEVLKGEDSLGLTITDNGAGLAFIKRIKEGSLMDRIGFVQVGDHIERIDERSMVNCRHYEVAKALKEIKKGDTFTLRLVEPLKAGFSHIGPRSGAGAAGGAAKKGGLGSGKETLRLRSKGPATVEQAPDNVIQAAVDKINALLESYMGINDSELATQIWELGCERPNPHEFVTAIGDSDLDAFGFTEDFLFDIWGAIGDARAGRLPAKDHAARTDL